MKKVLNLYAGLGGNRKLWQNCEITAVELNQKIANVYRKLYPTDNLIIADAHEYLINHFSEYDFIWSSPPCQSHSKMQKATRHNVTKYPDMGLYQEIIFLNQFFKGSWIVENVKPYYKPLIEPTLEIGRHLIWSNFNIAPIEIKQPANFIRKSNLQGKKEMMDWLDIHFDEIIYYEKNHCPVQVLRNCVHPEIGLHIFNSCS